MVKRFDGISPFLTAVYIIAVVILGFIVFTAVTNAPVIWQAESALGHPLSCSDAYSYRAIDSYFYPDRRLQGDTLYLYSLFGPLLLLGFLMLAGVLARKVLPRGSALRFKRPLILLLGIGAALFVVLLAYAPVIYTIACATE